MAHFLSAQRRDEFLSGDLIARFEMCLTGKTATPTLYVKSNTLDLYFVRKSRALDFDLVELPNQELMYLIGVEQGLGEPCLFYSTIESLSEKEAVRRVISGEQFDIILFNDFAIEIERSFARYIGPDILVQDFSDYVPIGPDFQHAKIHMMGTVARSFSEQGSRCRGSLRLGSFSDAVTAIVVSGAGNIMQISGFNQATEIHEMLPQIVGDHTCLEFFHSPEVELSASNKREFSDALICSDEAILSIQAKSFEFDGPNPPESWPRAQKRMAKSVRKAARQTKGSSRMMTEGRALVSGEETIDCAHRNEVFFSVFVPTLAVLDSASEEVLRDLCSEVARAGHFLIVLDPMQFLRTLQASGPFARRESISREKAFFELLRISAKRSRESNEFTTPVIYRW